MMCAAAACGGSGQVKIDDTLLEGMPDVVLSEGGEGVKDARLRSLLTRHWAWTMRRWPTWASELGITTFNDQLDDLSAEAIASASATRLAFYQEAQHLSILAAGPSSPSDRLTLSLFKDVLQAEIAREVCDFESWNVSPNDAALSYFNRLPEVEPLTSPSGGAALLSRYHAAPNFLANREAHLRRGLSEGKTANAESARRVIEMLDTALAQPVETWPMIRIPTEKVQGQWSESERVAFTKELVAVVSNEVRPALEAHRAFLAAEILPNARDEKSSGLTSLPQGARCYEALIQYQTTLPLTAAELHATGLAEIERINAAMRDLGERLFSTRDLPEILRRLREDSSLYFQTEDEIVKAAEAALAQAKAKIPAYFGRLPQADCVVTRIPAHEAPYTTIAYYRPPPAAAASPRPGEYAINVHAPTTRPRFESKVLAYHESIPGHHLQIAISQELPALPAFRRYDGATAFVEGWALYTESLAEEMGLYDTDLDRMGRLSFEAWRASRLVVDTGMHAMGWTRSQAKTFMLEHTALTPQNIDNEVDRYISWPAQALAYKTGQLEILRLRAQAEAALGTCFNLPAFHDIVLGEGAVSLPTLQRQITDWITREQTKPCP